jgi:hypothetical protein
MLCPFMMFCYYKIYMISFKILHYNTKKNTSKKWFLKLQFLHLKKLLKSYVGIDRIEWEFK